MTITRYNSLIGIVWLVYGLTVSAEVLITALYDTSTSNYYRLVTLYHSDDISVCTLLSFVMKITNNKINLTNSEL